MEKYFEYDITLEEIEKMISESIDKLNDILKYDKSEKNVMNLFQITKQLLQDLELEV